MENRREFFRLNLSIPFAFTVVDSGLPKTPRNRVFTHHTEDLSGGGLGFETSFHLEVGDILQIELVLPDSPVRSQARVVWAQMTDICRGGLEFVNIDEEVQDRIVGFLFREQVEERRRQRLKVAPIQPI